jgi:hypothetical protein
MMMADRAVSGRSVADVETWAIGYIKELRRTDRLPPEEVSDPWYERYDTGAYGYAFWTTDSYQANFQRVYAFLRGARSEALAATFPAIAEQLLTEMNNAPEAFAEKLTSTRSGENPYAYLPVLAGVDAEKFVETWMAAPKKNWRHIFRTLTRRYKGNEEHLEAERDWLESVRRDLTRRADKGAGLARLRLLRIVPPLPPKWRPAAS